MKILECPFCGENMTEINDSMMDGQIGFFWVECNSCGAEGPAQKNKNDAVASWNSRAEIPDATRKVAN